MHIALSGLPVAGRGAFFFDEFDLMALVEVDREAGSLARLVFDRDFPDALNVEGIAYLDRQVEFRHRATTYQEI